MSKRRATIARRLVEAQHNAAMLTTFNEIDMTAVMGLRERHREAFKQQFGVGLGVVSFFVKVAVAVLRTFPQPGDHRPRPRDHLRRGRSFGVLLVQHALTFPTRPF